jgi:hypothetical protein
MCYDYNKLLEEIINIFTYKVIMLTITIIIGVVKAIVFYSLMQMSVAIKLSFTSILLFRRWIEYT